MFRAIPKGDAIMMKVQKRLLEFILAVFHRSPDFAALLKVVNLNIGANRHTLANSEHLEDKPITQVEVWVDVTSCEKQLLELLDVLNCY
ncbi:hypothetical protein LOK49_LG03G03357 [Camellia lanceoleosa]|uniref:Uncharacterized protein n=1 Tax=Camellia lanceoleosa TaxID=1840588 RepID=A0ACC0IAJ1_9ERIC|nr:hypothetical protein LOK49_LG03G03357 [Camellia lanceoleosa]